MAKKFLQSQPGDDWANAFAGIDTTFGTRGFTAIHGGSTMKALAYWGALLAFYVMSRNSLTNPHCTATCSMERAGIDVMCPELKEAGFGEKTSKFAIDGDVKLMSAIREYFPRLLPRACSGL